MVSHANKVFTPTVQNCVNISSFVLCPVCCPSRNPVLLEFKMEFFFSTFVWFGLSCQTSSTLRWLFQSKVNNDKWRKLKTFIESCSFGMLSFLRFVSHCVFVHNDRWKYCSEKLHDFNSCMVLWKLRHVTLENHNFQLSQEKSSVEITKGQKLKLNLLITIFELLTVIYIKHPKPHTAWPRATDSESNEGWKREEQMEKQQWKLDSADSRN